MTCGDVGDDPVERVDEWELQHDGSEAPGRDAMLGVDAAPLRPQLVQARPVARTGIPVLEGLQLRGCSGAGVGRVHPVDREREQSGPDENDEQEDGQQPGAGGPRGEAREGGNGVQASQQRRDDGGDRGQQIRHEKAPGLGPSRAGGVWTGRQPHTGRGWATGGVSADREPGVAQVGEGPARRTSMPLARRRARSRHRCARGRCGRPTSRDRPTRARRRGRLRLWPGAHSRRGFRVRWPRTGRGRSGRQREGPAPRMPGRGTLRS